ncbi:MAG: hypothetical protein ACTTJW_08070 [Sphaerochaeta sp.]
MSRKKISTSEELQSFLKSAVSEKRYIHSLGVAETTDKVLEHFGCIDYEPEWNGFYAPMFCGLVHDLAREMTDAEILSYCKRNGIFLSKEDIEAPVLAHGTVSAELAMSLVGNYPMSWYKALCVHTTGNAGMDSLALALFTADYIEPSRTFMTDGRRSFYLGSLSIEQCAYRVLCDMIEHWKDSGFHDASSGSLAMKRYLEEVFECRY